MHRNATRGTVSFSVSVGTTRQHTVTQDALNHSASHELLYLVIIYSSEYNHESSGMGFYIQVNQALTTKAGVALTFSLLLGQSLLTSTSTTFFRTSAVCRQKSFTALSLSEMKNRYQ